MRLSVILISFFLVFPPFGKEAQADNIIRRNYARAALHLCQRVLGNLYGPPAFLAGITDEVNWSAGPLEGTWRREGVGESPHGRIDIIVSRDRTWYQEGRDIFKVPVFGEGWRNLEVRIINDSGIPVNDRTLERWVKGFEKDPGIQVIIFKDRKTGTKEIIISVKAKRLYHSDFQFVAAQMLSRIFNPK